MKRKSIQIYNHIHICSYGCGNVANFKFYNGKYCCHDEWFRCPAKRKERSRQMKDSWKNPDNNMGSISHLNKTKESVKKAWKKPNVRVNWMTAMKGNNTLTIETIKKRHPTFCNIEELRGKKLIETRCHHCNKWFAPTYNQLFERIRQLEHPDGNGGAFLFCSDDCKYESNDYYKALRTNPDVLKEYQKYTYKVYKYTRITLKKHGDKIKNLELRGRNKLHLDHKYSIAEGFKNNVDPKLIAFWKNLEMLPEHENIKKGTKCSITLSSLESFALNGYG